MEATLVSQGLDLLLYGMGTVFAFVTLLVGVTSLMSVIEMSPALNFISASFNCS